jgi:hypothetical protein
VSFEEDVDAPDVDGLAFSLLREADMVGLLRPSMAQLARRLGMSFAFDVPLGAHTFLENSNVIHLTPTGDKAELQQQTGHELGHAGLDDVGVPKFRQELYAERIRVALQMPVYGVHTLTRNHGFSPQMFAQFYRNVCPPVEAIHRAAYLSGTPIILHSNVMGRVAITETREGQVDIELSAKEERKLLARVRETGRWEPWGFGLIAYPWRLGLHRGVAITVDMRRSLSRVVYGYEAAE